ncbi:uncharacterized protein LOC129004205 isoform X2 [Macrosteles quadrilineatus]|nr:uncharacterized protein LOC129004205 isoform X2 [Macrosteles quadrilineatus]XP_054288658.1 uncharacterized protein LOC129004205 isoform X2 [Macrosteles quadrilineatus]XP_054288659.1 uncharacterized protein LOC129004205 isoform X2 [Macrosteles quadrilineatus]XP_054288661.1 uncharacterized protein LOC129004205 isoform X2 [Macrosteles quadrilineatus]XP_054288662.1 uncharacterized protein LOC129004205 isoform X2 [Macrosteles quadrilineatus]
MEDLQPGWLDEGFIKQVLRSVENIGEDHISVSKWKCNPAVPPGSNYLSLLYRLSVDYEIENDQRSISLIVKTPLESGQVKEWLEKSDGYGKELRMYRDVLPRMYEISWSIVVTARSYPCNLHNSLVLEDLTVLGYKMADRLKQLDFAHCRQFFISLATFHGLSIALYQKNPELIQSIGKSSWFSDDGPEEDIKEQEKFTKFNIATMMKTVKSIGLDRYAEIIQGKLDTFYSTMQQIFKPQGELRVLCHGDCWTTNFLFKYESGKVVDSKLIDFQIIRTGSFAQDIHYFWWTSVKQEVQENSQEELFEVYRETLNQTLEKAQVSERISKDEFDKEIKRYSPYGFFVCSSILSVAMADPDNLADFNEMGENEFDKPVNDEDSPFSKNFRSKYYKARLPALLKLLETFGALD